MKKTLLTTNRHLQNISHREQALSRNIESSSAIEGLWVKRDAKTGRFVAARRLSDNTRSTSTKRDSATGRFVTGKA